MTREDILDKWDAMDQQERDIWIAEVVLEKDYTLICGNNGPLQGKRTTESCNQILGKYNFDGTCPKCGWIGSKCWPIHKYSKQISAAWEVVEKTDMGVQIIKRRGCYGCIVYDLDNIQTVHADVDAETTPEAICKASLLYVLGR